MKHMRYSIRKSNPGDVAAVTELLRASYPPLMKVAYDATMLAPALKLMTRANPSLLSSGTYYVAESENGTVIGCGGWTRERPGGDADAPGVGHIRHFGTHPDWIRLGVGSAIFRRCKADARAAGIHEFECYASLNAERFYAALGFERIAVIDLPLTRDVAIKSCHMRCRIGHQPQRGTRS